MSQVMARLRYLVPGIERPVYIASRGGADAALSIDAEFEERELPVHDARQLAPPATLDRQGFALVGHETSINDFYELEQVREAYESEITDLVLAATGAAAAQVFDHTLRSDSSDIRGQRSTREPANVIHNDYTDASAAKRLREILPTDEARRREQHRFAIVNVWRSVGNPVLKSPLACCDARTIAPGDLVTSERRARERTGELQLATWNTAHRWYYYPQMTRDEALLIKTFDSDCSGPARRSIHSAFANPAAPPDAPPRESMESRLMVFYE